MKLYYSKGACSLSPHIVALEAGLAVELVSVDLRTGTTFDGTDFKKVNPKGYVPTLVLDNGETLTEGPAIVQYLADQVPNKALIPGHGSLARYRAIEWLNFISTELHKSFGPLFTPQAPEASKVAAKENLGKRLDYVNQELNGKEYLLGSQFSVADAYLFTVLSWTPHFQIDLSSRANVAAFMERVRIRPAVQAALRAEGLTSGGNN